MKLERVRKLFDGEFGLIVALGIMFVGMPAALGLCIYAALETTSESRGISACSESCEKAGRVMARWHKQDGCVCEDKK